MQAYFLPVLFLINVDPSLEILDNRINPEFGIEKMCTHNPKDDRSLEVDPENQMEVLIDSKLVRTFLFKHSGCVAMTKAICSLCRFKTFFYRSSTPSMSLIRLIIRPFNWVNTFT